MLFLAPQAHALCVPRGLKPPSDAAQLSAAKCLFCGPTEKLKTLHRYTATATYLCGTLSASLMRMLLVR